MMRSRWKEVRVETHFRVGTADHARAVIDSLLGVERSLVAMSGAMTQENARTHRLAGKALHKHLRVLVYIVVKTVFPTTLKPLRGGTFY
jgi:hypothetical protein